MEENRALPGTREFREVASVGGFALPGEDLPIFGKMPPGAACCRGGNGMTCEITKNRPFSAKQILSILQILSQNSLWLGASAGNFSMFEKRDKMSHPRKCISAESSLRSLRLEFFPVPRRELSMVFNLPACPGQARFFLLHSRGGMRHNRFPA